MCLRVIGDLMKDSEKIFADICEMAESHPDVIGCFLGGSRGKGLVTEHSDYDVYIIVKDGLVKSYMKLLRDEFPVHNRYSWVEDAAEKLEVKGFGGIMVFSLSGFGEHAAIGSPFEWNRYNFAHLEVSVDKNGQIQRLVNLKGVLPDERIRAFVSARLDGYINSVYRSLKCVRDGNTVGARLEAADSIQLFLNVAFGLEGRITPYYKYLEWELQKFPLKKLRIDPRKMVRSLLKILENADVETQKRLFQLMEITCRREGYGQVLDSWGPELEWVRE